jgi:stage II sporulation protein D
MRRLLSLTLFALALGLAGGASAQPVFVFEGHGYGHGVGLSQWGAYGFAKNGWTYEQILAHYYRGTTLGPAPVRRIRVLLAKSRGSVQVSSDAPFVAVAGGKRLEIPAGTLTIGADLTITLAGEQRTLTAPIRLEPGAEPLRFERPYRGALVVHRIGDSLSVVNDVKLEHYVYAIVPHEMPMNWELEALRTQAVAARTYAVITRKTGTYYDFEHNPIAQAYEGVDEETLRTNLAVDETKGQIVLYEGKPAWTYYSSSSGGQTASLTDAFPGGQDLPYLASVEDPYDTFSPYHNWEVRFTASDLASKLGLPGLPGRIELETSPSGRVTTLVASGDGWAKELAGPSLRGTLGLRSTLFTVKREGTERSSVHR